MNEIATALLRSTVLFVVGLTAATVANGQTMLLSTSSSDYQITNIFSDVDFFRVDIEIDAPLAPGLYIDPDIISVDYQVTGELVPGTPSDFPAFDLMREMTGAEFYEQGSSLSFEIAPSAVLSDGVQVAELVGNTVVLTFNAREVDNGRFHPALLELDANGTGRIQNSNNVPTLNPLVEVGFGTEYITDLVYDPGNTDIITAIPAPVVAGGGSSANSAIGVVTLILLAALTRIRVRRRRE